MGRFPVVLLVMWLAACGGTPASSDAGTVDASTPFDAGADAGFDAGIPDAGVDAGTVAVFTDLALAGYPHSLDVYLPSNAERVIVFLHGGGGTKELGAARESGVRLDDPPEATPKPDTAWLLQTRTAWVFPQGQHIQGALLAKTWNNYLMISGVDDKAFLSALSSALRAGTINKAVPAFSHVYLSGHSNGGVMANRQWCEATTSFDGYGSLSGPPSVELLPTGAHPCAPSAPRPFLSVIGGADTILQTKDNWAGPWEVNACLQAGAGASMPNPKLANEEPFYDNRRVPSVCSGTASASTSAANATTWSDCNGLTKLIRVEGADHCVSATTKDACVGGVAGGGCTNSLDAMYGTRMRDVLVTFFASTEH